MSEFGIIALSIFIGAFALVLLLSAIALIYLYLRARQSLLTLESLIASTTTEMKLFVSSIETSLTDKLSLIDGDGIRRSIVEFAKRMDQMAKFVSRAELAALAMGDMARSLLADQSIPRNNLAPEEYAQPDAEGGKYITQSDAAKRDAQTLEDM